MKKREGIRKWKIWAKQQKIKIENKEEQEEKSIQNDHELRQVYFQSVQKCTGLS